VCRGARAQDAQVTPSLHSCRQTVLRTSSTSCTPSFTVICSSTSCDAQSGGGGRHVRTRTTGGRGISRPSHDAATATSGLPGAAAVPRSSAPRRGRHLGRTVPRPPPRPSTSARTLTVAQSSTSSCLNELSSRKTWITFLPANLRTPSTPAAAIGAGHARAHSAATYTNALRAQRLRSSRPGKAAQPRGAADAGDAGADTSGAPPGCRRSQRPSDAQRPRSGQVTSARAARLSCAAPLRRARPPQQIGPPRCALWSGSGRCSSRA
jgi:hypothetical protein